MNAIQALATVAKYCFKGAVTGNVPYLAKVVTNRDRVLTLSNGKSAYLPPSSKNVGCDETVLVIPSDGFATAIKVDHETG